MKILWHNPHCCCCCSCSLKDFDYVQAHSRSAFDIERKCKIRVRCSKIFLQFYTFVCFMPHYDKKRKEEAKNWKLLYFFHISPFSLDEYIMEGFASREKQIGSQKFRVNASKNHSIFINCGNSKRSKVVIIYRDSTWRVEWEFVGSLIETLLIKTCGNSRSSYLNAISLRNNFRVILIHIQKRPDDFHHQLTSKKFQIMPKSLESFT